MKCSISIVLCASVLSTQAQQCWFTNDPMYGHEAWFRGGFVHDDGTMRTLGSGSWSNWATHSSLWSTDGQVLWNKYFRHMDMQKHMWSSGIDRTDAGGAALAGVFYHGFGYNSYTNMYGAVVDANGDSIWARYYMLDSIRTYELYCKITQAVDGGYFYVAQNNVGLSLSKLDAGGVPVWTKRYSPGHIGNNIDAYHEGYVIPEDNGELTIFGKKLGNIYMARTDAQGNVLWHRKYPGIVGMGIRAANGDYLCAGRGGSPNYTPYLTRLDHDGNVLWHRSGPSSYSLLELASGHLLLTNSNYLITYLTELDADGSFIARWSAPMQEWPEYTPDFTFLPGSEPRGDSLAMGATGYYDGPVAPFMISASSTASLDCFGFTPAAALTSTLETNPVEIADDTLYVVQDSLKTWTMLIGPTQDANAFDPEAQVSGNYPSPGYDHTNYGRIVNNGTHSTGPVTATMTFDPILSYVSATPAPTSVVGQTITWQLPAIPAHSQQLVNAVFNTPPDPGLLGTQMDVTLSFVQDSTETSLLNNTATYHMWVLGSYDPNDKSVLPKDFYHIENDSTLEYTIRFQNTGTAPAQLVVLRDTLPASVDVHTFELLVTSHPCTYSISGNGVLVFTFNNINLPDSNANEPASHGLVSFKVKPILPLTLGQEITNAADIYFDFNPPIHTNDATVIVTDETSVRPVAAPDRLVAFPVPVRNTLTVLLPPHMAMTSAWAASADGRRVPLAAPVIVGGQAMFDAQHLAPGAYVLTMIDRNGGRLSTRFTKE